MVAEYQYDVITTRSADGWVVSIPQLGAVTRASGAERVASVARDYIAAARGLPLDEISVIVRSADGSVFDLPGV